ncbi:MAG: class I SAM-dependent methyltransferase [Flavobacteriales bacterium]
MSNRQRAVIIGGPIAILVFSYLLSLIAGEAAMLLSVALTGMLLAYLIVESRGFALELFERQLREGRTAYTQMEALQGLLWTFKPDAPWPSTRFWAASPDLLREITEHVLNERPALVVEASSGTSTLIIGLCLQRLGAGKVVALEHDPIYVEKTRAAIALHGLQEYATVIHAPLVEHVVKGAKHQWYDLSALQLSGTIDLLVVDGPPETTQKLARYPAVPLLAPKFSKGARVLLDDGSRPDERLMAQRWSEENPGSQLEFLYLEAGAWSLRMP